MVDGLSQFANNPCRGEKIKLIKKRTPVAKAIEPEMDVSIHRAK